MLSIFINNEVKVDYSKKVLIKYIQSYRTMYILKYFMCHTFFNTINYNFYYNTCVALRKLLCNVVLMLLTFNSIIK